jgi:hypothetical protein
VFVYLFAKNSLGNVKGSQVPSLQVWAMYWLKANDGGIDRAIAAGEIIEVRRAKTDHKT